MLAKIFGSLNKAPVAFIIKGSPDPDVIASSLALCLYYTSVHQGTGKIYYQDPVSHPSNKSMVNVLGISLTRYETVDDLLGNTAYVICDCNEVEVTGFNIDKCILHVDHHKETKPYKDLTQIIESDAGSTCTIVTRLLNEENWFSNNSENAQRVATALAYGIKSDTDNLDSATPKDLDALKILTSYYSKDVLKQITRQRITTQTAEVLKKALIAEEEEQHWLYAGVGFLQESYRDSIASVADELIKRVGIECVMVYAIIEKSNGEFVVDASVRSIDSGMDIDEFTKKFSPQSGGRKHKGGFQIPLGFWSGCPDRDLIEKFVSETITGKFKGIIATTSFKGTVTNGKNGYS